MHVVGIDLGGHIDTVQFNRRPKDYTPNERRMCQEALEQVAAAIDRGDVQLLGEACTRSARIHQRILPKPELPDIIRIAEETGGAGVSVAHSGTVVGLIYAADRSDGAVEAETRALKAFPQATAVRVDAITRATRTQSPSRAQS
jgi:L-threonine kinase